MTRKILKILATPLLVLGLTACSSMAAGYGQDQPMAGMEARETPFSAAEMDMHRRMMAAQGSDTAHTWAMKMIEHHQGAIDMARIVLRDARDDEVRRMAQQTIDEQTRGIAELRDWLQRHPA